MANEIRPNPLKLALPAGRPQIGTWINLVRNPAVLRIDGMKRLASRLTWWHRLPHTSTPRGRAWATTCGDPSTRLAPVSPMGAVGPPVTAPAASPSTAVVASMPKAMALIGGRRDTRRHPAPGRPARHGTITKERPWATSTSCTR